LLKLEIIEVDAGVVGTVIIVPGSKCVVLSIDACFIMGGVSMGTVGKGMSEQAMGSLAKFLGVAVDLI
jgi:hypothetical protein